MSIETRPTTGASRAVDQHRRAARACCADSHRRNRPQRCDARIGAARARCRCSRPPRPPRRCARRSAASSNVIAGRRPEIGGAALGESAKCRRASARAHPVGARVRPRDEAGGVGDAALDVAAARSARESDRAAVSSPGRRAFSAHARCVISRSAPTAAHALQSCHAPPRNPRRGSRADSCRCRPSARLRSAACPAYCSEHRDLLERVHDELADRARPQPASCSRRNTPSSSTMRLRDARGAQRQCLPRDARHRMHPRRASARAASTQAVPVGVGLDDRDDARIAARVRRTTARLWRSAAPSIVAQRKAHRNDPSPYADLGREVLELACTCRGRSAGSRRSRRYAAWR